MSVGLLFDSTRCIGCGACSAACKEANGLPLPIEEQTTAYTWTVVENVGGVNVRRLCFHCARADLRLGMPGGRAAEDRRGAGCLRRRPLHRLPLLHHGLPVRRAEVPVGSAHPDRREVHPVRRTRRAGAADGVRSGVPDRSDALRRARRARRSEARARIAAESGHLRRPRLRRRRGRRHLCAHALGRPVREARNEDRRAAAAAAAAHLAGALEDPVVRRRLGHVPLRRPLDHEAARGSQRLRGDSGSSER